jgi:transcription antitermination factor NusG
MMEFSTTRIDSSFISLEPEKALHARPHWYAVYTCANHERSVSDQLMSRGVEHFLPQYESVRRWKDRKMRLHLPLFPGYVFVYLALQNRLRVLQVPGVVRLVGFDGHPVAVPEEEVARVRQFLNEGFQVEPHKYLQSGRRVRVKSGPLEGMEGIIVRRKNRSRLVLSFDLIQRSLAVEIGETDVAPVAVRFGKAVCQRLLK